MANYSTAALVKAQTRVEGAFQAGELRFREPVVHKLFLQNTQIMMPDYLALRTREDRPVETDVKLRISRTLGTGRSHNHAGSTGDSSTLTPSWTTYNDVFVTTLKQSDNKLYTMGEIEQNELNNVIANFSEGLDEIASDYLFNNRSQVNTATVEGTFDAVNFAFEIAVANENRSAQIAKAVMDINKYQGMGYDVVCDTIAFNKFEFYANQGTGNNENTSFQFMGMNFVHDASLNAKAVAVDAAWTQGFWMMVPRGTIAALPWIPVQNRNGHQDSEGLYGQLINPIDGIAYAFHSYEERLDGTSIGGYTQDVKTEAEISLDIAYQHAPLSTANETTIQAFALT